MIMTPMTLIIVSAVADGKTRGAATRIRAKASHGASALSFALHDLRLPMRPVGRKIRTRTSRR